jgi:hypothetical protein
VGSATFWAILDDFGRFWAILGDFFPRQHLVTLVRSIHHAKDADGMISGSLHSNAVSVNKQMIY